jgi:hypothetical protein
LLVFWVRHCMGSNVGKNCAPCFSLSLAEPPTTEHAYWEEHLLKFDDLQSSLPDQVRWKAKQHVPKVMHLTGTCHNICKLISVTAYVAQNVPGMRTL